MENLRLLCPNCHSQTDTYCGKSKGKKEKPINQLVIKQDKIYLKIERKTKITWPSKDELEEMFKLYSCTSIAKKLGVTDNAVRKHAKKHNIDIKNISPWSHKSTIKI